MEEGIYEVDVHTLEVIERDQRDGNAAAIGDRDPIRVARLSRQGASTPARVARLRQQRRTGDLASQRIRRRLRRALPSGTARRLDLVRRNQFTEVTGPGGIYGNADPDTDPIWTVGWDAAVADPDVSRAGHLAHLPPAQGQPLLRRRPRLEHRMAAHPRHRRRGPADDHARHVLAVSEDLPPANSAGIAPRSNYLKVIGDFCRWKDRIVLGCDDTARSEFLNKRKAKGKRPAPQSQSNLWFIEPEQLDQLGPVIGAARSG